MREKHSEDGNCGLQDGGQSGGNIFFAPEEERIIQAEHEQAGETEQEIIEAMHRQDSHAPNGDGHEHGNRDHEANGDERDRWQIAQPDFHRDPRRAPHDAEHQIRGGERKLRRLLRHRLPAHCRLEFANQSRATQCHGERRRADVRNLFPIIIHFVRSTSTRSTWQRLTNSKSSPKNTAWRNPIPPPRRSRSSSTQRSATTCAGPSSILSITTKKCWLSISRKENWRSIPTRNISSCSRAA